jgi:uncharacterized protein (DUF1800 family)
MLRPTAALALALCAASCAKGDGADESPPPPLPESARVGQVPQALDTNETPSEANSIRFLEQSSFGPKLSRVTGAAPLGTVEHVMAVGIPAAIDEQLADSLPRSRFESTVALDAQFFVAATTGPDQLRQRVAFALSQILVASEQGIPNNTTTPEVESRVAMAGYLNLLSDQAFGNFRDLLEAVTRSPTMGRYLDMVNNRAFDRNGQRIEPNENYAREVLQLFTLGLHKLNLDGTPKTDENGALIPAYTEAQVQAFAHTLSGWTYRAAACPGLGRNNLANYTEPMMACDANHDARSQELLRGVRTTEGASAEAHLRQAINNIFNDPNVPPFISKQLIQHLVTSNPSGGYVSRVATVFKDDGTGTRGNLAAVVRAILTDAEARGAQAPTAQAAAYGHLRSPVLFITTLVRWLDASLDTQNKNPGARLATWSRGLNQAVARSPSVFSFYPPNAPLPTSNAAGKVGPEFAILDTATITARANFVHELVLTSVGTNNGITLDYTLLPTSPADLTTYLGRYWLHGTMSSELRQTLSTALGSADAGNAQRRQKLAVYLLSLSPSYQIQR